MISGDAADRLQPHLRRHRCAGLTFMELLLALAGTALIAMAVAMMLSATSYGSDSSRDLRSVMVRARTVSGRLNATLRCSQMVLAKGEDYLVLWSYDERHNDAPNRSEIQYIVRDSASQLLRSYRTVWPATMTLAEIDAADTSYDLGEDFAALVAGWVGDPTFPGEAWAGGITAWTVTLDDPEPQEATMVNYRLDLLTGTISETAVGAAVLRTGGRTKGNG